MSAIARKNFSRLCRPYQNDAVTFLYEHDEALLLLRMGGGKTVITVSAAQELLRDGVIKNVLVVAPLPVCNNTWRTEYLEWEHTADLDLGIATGTPTVRKRVLDARHTITVINYENLQWLAQKYPGRTWDLIVLDEVTRLARHNGKRYRALRPYLERATLRWGLTGSLATASLEAVFNPVRAIDLGASLGATIGPFRREFFTKAQFGYNMIPGSEVQVAGRIEHLCFQPDPKVYASQLPDLVVQRHGYELGDDIVEVYRDLVNHYVAEVDGEHIDVASAGVLVNKLAACASGFLYNEEGEPLWINQDRLSIVLELVTEAAPESVLVWYWFRATGDLLRDHGFVDLVETLDDWNAGRVPIACCQYRSGSHGLNAQAGGSRQILMEHSYSQEEREQSIARLHRQGQSEVCFVHEIVGEIDGVGAIDADILEAQTNKRGVANAVAKKLLREAGEPTPEQAT